MKFPAKTLACCAKTRRNMALTLTVVAFAAALTGCLSRAPLTRKSFNFSPGISSTNHESSNETVEVRRVTVAAPFATQSFVYRTGQYSYEHDPYAQFLVPPEEALSTALSSRLQQRGFTVAEPGSLLAPNILMEANVSQLYGDFRNRARPEAVLSMNLVLLKSGEKAEDKASRQKTFTVHIPLAQRTAAALMAGWNKALDQIVNEATASVKAAETSPGAAAPVGREK